MSDEFSAGVGGSVGGSSDQTLTFIESTACKTIVADNFLDICRQVLEQRTSKSSYVQQSLFNILPRLGAFNKDLFCQTSTTSGLVMIIFFLVYSFI
jgi:hypothetical protein